MHWQLLAVVGLTACASAQSIYLEAAAQFGDPDSQWTEALKADGAGGFYGTGRVQGGSPGGDDVYTFRAGPDLAPLWTRRLGSLADDYAESLASDGADGFFVAGFTSGDLATGQAFPQIDRDPFLIKLDAQGNVEWQYQASGPEWVRNVHVATDGQGGALLAWSSSLSPQNSLFQIKLARFDASGALLWQTTPAASGSDYVRAIIPGPDNSAYLIARAAGSMAGQPNAGGWDAAVLRVDGSGSLLWARLIGTPASDDALNGALAPDGGLFVVGSTVDNPSGSPTLWLTRLAPDGSTLWFRGLPGLFPGFERQGLAASGDGMVTVAGTTQSPFASSGQADLWLARFGPDGTPGPTLVIGSAQNEFDPSLVATAEDRVVLGSGTRGDFPGPNAGYVDTLLAEFVIGCQPDMTTTAVPGSPGYGTPNGVLNNDDFFYYITQFAAGNLAVADVTTSAIPGSPGYGIPNGVLNNDDFFYYLTSFAAGC